MEKFLQMVDSHASSSKIDKEKLASFLVKFLIWEFAGMIRQAFQQFSKEEKSDLIFGYDDAMKVSRVKQKKLLLVDY